MLSPLWFAPTLIPALAQGLTFLHDNYLYKNNDYADGVNLLKDTNKVGKAKALKSFVESCLGNASLSGSSDDRLEERCMDLASELSRRGVLDITLSTCKKSYATAAKFSFYCFITDLAVGLVGLVSGIAYPSTRMWWFAAGMALAICSVGSIFRLMNLSARLNTLKENEDLRT